MSAGGPQVPEKLGWHVPRETGLQEQLQNQVLSHAVPKNSSPESRVSGRRKLVNNEAYVFIIDEWMSSALDDSQVSFVFEVIESRYQEGSTIFCTQFAPNEWLDRLGGGPQADAITDRIVHSTIFFESGELNMRETMSTVRSQEFA